VSVSPKAAVKSDVSQRFLAFIGIVKSLKHNKTNSMGDFLIFPLPFSVPGYSVKDPINSTR
jgi:hypothetical protein